MELWWWLTVLFTGVATGVALGYYQFLFNKNVSGSEKGSCDTTCFTSLKKSGDSSSVESRGFMIDESSNNMNHDESDKREVGSSSSSSYEDIDDDEESEDEEQKYEDLRLKMVFVIRQTTPKLSPALAAKLVSRVAIRLVEDRIRRPEIRGPEGFSDTKDGKETSVEWLTWYRWWRRIGCAKITLKGEDNQSILSGMVEKAQRLCLPHSVIDFSEFLVQERKVDETISLPLTEGIAVIALGPAPSKNLDEITGNLKLMS